MNYKKITNKTKQIILSLLGILKTNFSPAEAYPGLWSMMQCRVLLLPPRWDSSPLQVTPPPPKKKPLSPPSAFHQVSLTVSYSLIHLDGERYKKVSDPCFFFLNMCDCKSLGVMLCDQTPTVHIWTSCKAVSGKVNSICAFLLPVRNFSCMFCKCMWGEFSFCGIQDGSNHVDFFQVKVNIHLTSWKS